MWFKNANNFILLDGQLIKVAGISDWFNKNLGITLPAFVISFLLSTGQADTFAKSLKSKTPQQRQVLVQKAIQDASSKNITTQPTQPSVESHKTEPGVVNVEEWVERIVQQESGGNPRARSRKGAGGLMQIMPATWTEVTRKLYGKPLKQDLRFNPEINKKVGIAYLKEVQKLLRNGLKKEPTIEQILAAYNGGAGRLIKLKGNVYKMPAESVNYFQKIIGKK